MSASSYTKHLIKPRRWPVTIEPMLFLYFLTHVLSSIVTTNMIYRKGCDPFATSEPDLRNYTCLRVDSAQQDVAIINSWKLGIQEFIALVFIIFAGPWSDNHGCRRRPLMFIPVVGQIVGDAANLLFAVYWQEISPAVTGITYTLLTAVSGSTSCFFIGMYSYLSDITDNTNRTMRLGFAGAIVPFASTLAPILSGYLNVAIGFKNLFILNVILNIIGLFLGSLLIYESSENKRQIKSNYKNTFSLKVVMKSVGTIFTERKSNKKLVLILMIITSPLTIAPFLGEMSLMYLFLSKKFNFNEVSFSLFYSYKMSIIVLGTLISLGLFSRLLRMNDAMIAVIATVFEIVASTAFLLVNQNWQLMYIPLLELFRGASLAITGSIASKCVESHELASVNSIKYTSDSLIKIIILPLYNIVYHNTLDQWPSAFFLISIVMNVPCLFLFLYTYFLTRKVADPAPREEEIRKLNELEDK
ncbi:tetracycline resistance protein, class A-like [Daktulosphaira vitifoliae]|uniref:tetracycline resistance protein, class A-like n=1 Tax=Daktulosphaira vitifoliae TaxID=58002 RepID=UPI0021AA3219|nr:tetracycline resistance protein, class A-like [Daktulosphaira vitifoliae]XP_050539850.1 tetracycline resistance protein, class A-like [Daktulosphaira vitifoliae]